jgi:hypothetical protein
MAPSWNNTIVSPSTGITLTTFVVGDVHLDLDVGMAQAVVKCYVDINKGIAEEILVNLPISSIVSLEASDIVSAVRAASGM